MRRSKSALRLSRVQQARAGLPNFVLSHKLKILWGLAVVWVLYLALSAGRRPAQLNYRHSRSLLEASALTGRLEALNFGQHPAETLREAVQKAINPVRPLSLAFLNLKLNVVSSSPTVASRLIHPTKQYLSRVRV